MKTLLMSGLILIAGASPRLLAANPPPSTYYNIALTTIETTAGSLITWAGEQSAVANQFNGWDSAWGAGAAGTYANFPVFNNGLNGGEGGWVWNFKFNGTAQIAGNTSLQELESLLSLYGYLPTNLSNHFVADWDANFVQWEHMDVILVIDILLPEAEQQAVNDLNEWYSAAKTAYAATGSYPPPPL